MKTAMIARFVLGAGAIFAVAGLAGCGAETGSEGPGAVGETSEAITVSTAPAVTTIPTGQERFGAASCTVHDSNVNRDYLIVAGGFDLSATPAGLSSVLAYDPGSPQSGKDHWTNVSVVNALGVARGYARAIRDPNDSSKCYVIGGEATEGGTVVPFTLNSSWNVDLVQVTATRTVTVTHTNTAAANLPTARSKIGLAACGLKIIAVGGRTAVTTASAAIEVLGSGTWATPTGSFNTLNTAMFDFGFAKDPSSDNFVVAGGNSGSARSSLIQLITTGSTCTTADVAPFNSTNQQLSTAREKLVAFPKQGTANTFLLYAGYSGAASNVLDTLNVTSWTAGAQTIANVTSGTQGTARIKPMLTFMNTGTPGYMVAGGESVNLTTTLASNNIDQFKAAGWDTSKTLLGDSSGVVDGVLEYVPSAGKAYLVSGVSVATGVRSFVTGGDEIAQ